MGRPTKYRKEYCEEIIEYFSVDPYRENVKRVASQGKQIEIDVTEANDFPSFAGFCSKLGIDRVTMLDWTRVHPDFLKSYKRAKELQENFLVVNGLKGTVNTAFGIFTAKNVLGWRDKVEMQHSIDDIDFDDDD